MSTATPHQMVLVLGLGSEAYGRERRVANLFRNAQRCRPYFLVPRWGDGSVDALLRRYGFEFSHAPFGYLGRARPGYSATTVANVPRLTRDILRAYRDRHCQSVLIASLPGFANALPALLLLRASGARIVLHLGDWVPQTLAYRALVPLLSWVAHGVIMNSNAGRRDLTSLGLDPSRIQVVYNGLSLEEFTPTRGADHRRTFGWGEDTVVVGWAGRFSRAKGAREFVRAAELVARDAPECRFVMFGRTDHVDSCHAEIERETRQRGLEGRLAFAGHVCDMPAAYAGLDVMVVPSRTETLPNVILEAMASGLPVVATRVAGIPEVVLDDVSGLLVPPEDPAALAGAIMRLARDREARRRMGGRAREEAARRFDARRSAALVEAILLGRS